jgi:hypothetical protein
MLILEFDRQEVKGERTKTMPLASIPGLSLICGAEMVLVFSTRSKT